MTNIIKNTLAVALVAVLIGIVGYFVSVHIALGSVEVASEYNGYLVTSANATGTALTVLKTQGGTLGSVVISSTSPTTTYPLITLYDATSTMATSSARKIGQFSGTPANGTYTYDAAVFYGVAIEVPVGFNGAYTVTWR